MDARVLVLDQEFDPDTLYALRAAVHAHVRQAGLSEDRVGEVVLAVHELAANAIAHGAGHGHFRLWDEAGTFSCEIADDGPGAQSVPPIPVPPRPAPRSPAPPRPALPPNPAARPPAIPPRSAPQVPWPPGRSRRATASGWRGSWPPGWTYGRIAAVAGS